MTPASLLPHPSTPAGPVHRVTVDWWREAQALSLRFIIDALDDALIWPEPRPAARADGLWTSTCAELFLRRPGEAGYREYNVAPSGAWAAYAFAGYREGMRPLDTPPPVVRAEPGVVEAMLALPPGPWDAGLSMVIEARDGTKSYWAIRHPPGRPDFHHPDCFALTLPAGGVP